MICLLIFFYKLNRNAFNNELTLLEKVRHPNVVQFVGAVTQNIPMMIVVEYHAKVRDIYLLHARAHVHKPLIYLKHELTTLLMVIFQGDLGSYLQKKGRLSPSKALRFALDIARHVQFIFQPLLLKCLMVPIE